MADLNNGAIRGGRYVALGSSFAAGPGIPPLVNRRARRSGRNYAQQVAKKLSLRLTDATHSGATTEDVLIGTHSRLRAPMPAQVEAIEPDTTLVTITVGGNDIGYIGGLITASLAARAGRQVARLSPGVAEWIRGRVDLEVDARRVEEATHAMTTVGKEVRRRAPRARVLWVDYLTVVGSHEIALQSPRSRLPLTIDDLRKVARTAKLLAEAFATAAHESGTELVGTSSASMDHGALSPEPWVTGFEGSLMKRDATVPYHPNLAGMTAVAELIVGHLTVSH
ncbi:SGNH/GDSL hydrolase family protein [Actinomadura sp. NTSP31]|uniref:SGNH/GDSL hydrolase family protein n=1 Tax=Actinomadura sp. NTSP31 TaxID=1735447 RepID=UPI0035C167C2